MKEATGELNMTVVIVIAVGILAAFFYFTIWPLIKNNYDRNANCAKAICTCTGKDNKNCTKTKGMADCYMKGDKDNAGKHFQCPWKG